MKDQVRVFENLAHAIRIANVPNDQANRTAQAFDVFPPAVHEIIDYQDIRILFRKLAHQFGADETGSPCDQHALSREFHRRHASLPFFLASLQ